MFEIGIIGNRSETLPFLAAGFSVFEADSDSEAADRLADAVRRCGILYISPGYYAALEDRIRHCSASSTTAILPLPKKNGGVGITRLKRFTEQAVGADILFRE